MTDDFVVGVIGLGYVGLPVAIAFAHAGFRTVGFDIDQSRIDELHNGEDRTKEFGRQELVDSKCAFTHVASDLGPVDFFIVTVPTPIDSANNPDLNALCRASETVGASMRRGAIVVYESTVYPGATEEVCVPYLERASGLVCGKDFTVGYSPERINPGDKEHTFVNIMKVVSGQDARTLDIVASLYGSVIKAGIHKAPSIRVAEAAKVIENSQRDLNIAFMNELSEIFGRLGIDTGEVLAAAGTKWNFLKFTPGLVGGHCIGVDPYYLTYRAEISGYHPEVILAGRRINDRMGQRIALECIRLLFQAKHAVRRVIVLGLTFKENVPDIRNSKVVDIVSELLRFGIDVDVVDEWAVPQDAQHEYGIALKTIDSIAPADAVVLAVSHERYVKENWALIVPLLRETGGAVIDVKGVLPRDAKPDNVTLWRL